MKALTLTQPWASLVALGHKRFETRSWSTNYRGELAIHAAKGSPMSAQARIDATRLIQRLLPAGPLPRGAVLCVVKLNGVFNARSVIVDDTEYRLGDFSLGRFAWALELVEVFDQPIPARGALGLWEWEP